MDHLIELKNITQSYNKEVILQDLTLSISQNQSIAFTGHNGCGKSTLLKLLAGLIRPTHGNVLYHGAPLFHYVPERFPKMNLTARQYLRHMGYLDGLSADDVKTRYEALCEEFFLSDMLDIPMKHLSKGTLQKVSVIQKEGAEIPDLCTGRIKSCCGKYRIEVKESESNPMIACMIREGWLLRRMEDADY